MSDSNLLVERDKVSTNMGKAGAPEYGVKMGSKDNAPEDHPRWQRLKQDIIEER